jgi:hypothetical protein
MIYIRATWNSDDARDPRILLYEASDDDRVTRRVEIFDDGSRVRDSVEWQSPAQLGQWKSLVEGPFLSRLPEAGDPMFTCSEVSADEFEAEWAAGA